VRQARSAAHWLRQAEPREAEAGATPFLGLLGAVLAAWLSARVAGHPDAPASARHAAAVFLDHILPRSTALAASATTPTAALIGTEPVA
jgi:hypothetical protein